MSAWCFLKPWWSLQSVMGQEMFKYVAWLYITCSNILQEMQEEGS